MSWASCLRFCLFALSLLACLCYKMPFHHWSKRRKSRSADRTRLKNRWTFAKFTLVNRRCLLPRVSATAVTAAYSMLLQSVNRGSAWKICMYRETHRLWCRIWPHSWFELHVIDSRPPCMRSVQHRLILVDIFVSKSDQANHLRPTTAAPTPFMFLTFYKGFEVNWCVVHPFHEASVS